MKTPARLGSALPLALAALAGACRLQPASSGARYEFHGGFPTEETIARAKDDADMGRAIQAYKFFFPTVSIACTWDGNVRAGALPNRSFLILEGSPGQLVLTPNSDTPYAGALLDLAEAGPMVVELPPGALMCVVNDLNQRYVMDMGLPGPDGGRGGKHLVLPPGYAGPIPAGYHTGTCTTNRALLMLRAIPPAGDAQEAIELLKTVKLHPLDPPPGWPELRWLALEDRPADFTPFEIEKGLGFWKRLHEVLEAEPPYEAYRMEYGELAALGIAKGRPFAPDARLQRLLGQAALIANAQMRVQSFGDRSPERLAWPDRRWEWAALRSENGTFDLPASKDLEAREKWFFQAQIESPAMFRRTSDAGSLYWLGLRDRDGAYLDGKKSYRLAVPLPVPAKLFWSVTVYDPQTRSEIKTDQGRAALRSLVELKDAAGSSVDLFFGPSAPPGPEARWIQTLPGKGFFAYFRVYGPEAPAFDGTWKPGDFELLP